MRILCELCWILRKTCQTIWGVSDLQKVVRQTKTVQCVFRQVILVAYVAGPKKRKSATGVFPSDHADFGRLCIIIAPKTKLSAIFLFHVPWSFARCFLLQVFASNLHEFPAVCSRSKSIVLYRSAKWRYKTKIHTTSNYLWSTNYTQKRSAKFLFLLYVSVVAVAVAFVYQLVSTVLYLPFTFT